MTKKELLIKAAALQIVGRHDMSKEVLAAKIEEIVAAHKEVASARKRKKIANVKRNKVFKYKFYFADVVRATEALATEKMPRQARLMLEGMLENGFTSAETAVIGSTIASSAKINTTIPAAALAAYYLPMLNQKFGVVFSHYA